ncbi:dTDP-4-dehydrorhamnose 3,5-epimerase [Altibacter sp. HG106]|uniref:dTDP-4-dehydrorhamnose 3,5-epimerase n=1 Tax=Altibacter sp. HG106 TaxID=3023937 RepID=UPI00235039AD|nr:dTDP-4-dehydrorhamnose 3,5-epimerase [Altibacter sp. HG106]MDC7994999.1 dTDP-4-dehydrorhamnose 3,5-epimerase [Altibacter sp. HG106]
MLHIEKTPLLDCFVLIPPAFPDARGQFSETYNKRAFQAATGLDINFVQDNQSISKKGVLRGLHFQTGPLAQAKLVRVIDGSVLDIVVDLRKESASFGQHFSVLLTGENRKQLFVPKGFAHGFVTLSERSIFAYKCDQFYDKASEGGIIYNDATLALDWHLPKEALIISEKDLALPSFQEVIS